MTPSNVCALIVSLIALPLTVTAQQRDETPTLNADGSFSGIEATPSAPVPFSVLAQLPQEHRGRQVIEGMHLLGVVRKDGLEGGRALYVLRMRYPAADLFTDDFYNAKVSIVTTDDRLGGQLVALKSAGTTRRYGLRLYVDVRQFADSDWRHHRADRDRPFWAANVYRVERLDKDGAVVEQFP